MPFEAPCMKRFLNFLYLPVIASAVSHSLSEDEVRECATIWNNTTKKLVLVGVNEPRAISDSTIETLAADESVVVLTETTSNVHHPTFINTIDTLITPLRTKSLRIFVLKY
jgi:2-succinyl-5-enolpyruvyl-6-hydroxy-3-cyclohexene-1-carboxylate synthase